MDKKQEVQTAWDSREKWTTELVYRIHLVLDSDHRNVKGWYENVHDLFDLAACAVDNPSNYEKELEELEHLIYASRVNGRVLTERDRRERMEQAYKGLRRLFRLLHTEIYKKGLIIPFRSPYDEVDGFMAQFK